MGSAFALGSSTAPLTMGGGTLDLNGYSLTVGTLSGNAGTVLTSSNASVTLTANPAAATTFGGVLTNGSGTLGLTKGGNGMFTLTGNNSYAGPTTISAGTLAIGNGSTGSLSSTSTVNLNAGALAINQPSGSTFGNNINISGGGLVVSTAGTETLSGNITVQATAPQTAFNFANTTLVLSGTNSLNANTGVSHSAGILTIAGNTTISSTATALNSYNSANNLTVLNIAPGGILTIAGAGGAAGAMNVGAGNGTGSRSILNVAGTLNEIIFAGTGLALGGNTGSGSDVGAIWQTGTANIAYLILGNNGTATNSEGFYNLQSGAVLNIGGGSLNNNGGTTTLNGFVVGKQGAGIFYNAGATIIAGSGGDLNLASRAGGGPAVYYQTGGLYSGNSFGFANGGGTSGSTNGTITIAGGAMTLSRALSMGSTTSTAILNLNGGTLQTTQINPSSTSKSALPGQLQRRHAPRGLRRQRQHPRHAIDLHRQRLPRRRHDRHQRPERDHRPAASGRGGQRL